MAAHAAVNPDQILRDLAKLWVTVGEQGRPETGMGVLRACSLNLVVVADESDDFQALGETVAALMPEHPARSIVIRLRTGAGSELAGRVFSQCWMPFGQRRQICCEQVEITASQDQLEDAFSLAAAVAAPDLPVVAWCRSPRLAQRPDFVKLFAPGARIVVDSARFEDGRPGLERLAEWAGKGLPLGDLSWTRLTRWREMLAQSFENRELRERLPEKAQIRVAYGGSAAPPTARYMAAWVVQSLQAAGVSAVLNLVPDPSASEDQLSQVELTGGGLRMRLSYGDGWLSADVGGVMHCASLSAPTDYMLMREEMGIVRRDPVFERALRAAAAL